MVQQFPNGFVLKFTFLFWISISFFTPECDSTFIVQLPWKLPGEVAQVWEREFKLLMIRRFFFSWKLSVLSSVKNTYGSKAGKWNTNGNVIMLNSLNCFSKFVVQSSCFVMTKKYRTKYKSIFPGLHVPEIL